MSASLVGSEMCIRDRSRSSALLAPPPQSDLKRLAEGQCSGTSDRPRWPLLGSMQRSAGEGLKASDLGCLPNPPTLRPGQGGAAQ
eukprot:7946476-Alexandrium_andersonii.AAC.1